MQPVLGVHDEQEQIGLADRLHDLPADLRIHRIVRIVRQPAGVDQPKGAAVPVGEAEVTVARGAGLVTDDGRLPADDAIEERGFADVGAANDGDDRCTHAATAWSSCSSTSMKS